MRYIRFVVLGLLIMALSLMATTVLAQDRINVGDSVQGTRTTGNNDYLIDLEAGKLIVITVVSEAFDSNVRVLNADGVELGFDDDSAGNRNPSLAFFVPVSGTYTIRVGAFFDMGSGDFTLSVASGVVIGTEIGGSASTEFDGTPRFFSFSGSAGDVVTLRIASEQNTSTNLLVTAPDGTVLADTSSILFFFGSTQVRRAILPLDGLYSVKVTSYSSDISDNVTVSIEADTVISLDNGAATVTLSEATTDFDIVRFTATAGATYILSASTDNPEKGFEVQIPLSTDSFGFTTTAELTIRRANAGMIEFTTPNGGVIAINVRESSFFSFNENPSNITISIQAK